MNSTEQRDTRIVTIALGLMSLAFLIFKASHFFVRMSDGPVYALMAQALTEGLVPYRDFFFAHPLGHLIALIPWVKSMQAWPEHLDFAADLVEVANAILIYHILRSRFLGRTGGSSRLVAWALSCFYLGSFSVMATSDHTTGIHLSLFWVLLAFLCEGRAWSIQTKWLSLPWAVLPSALALITRFYTAPLIVALVLGGFAKNRRRGITLAVGAFGLFSALLGLHYFVGGSALFDSLFMYHLAKKEFIPRQQIFHFFVVNDGLFLVGLVGLPLLAWRREWTGVLALICPATLILIYSDLYYFYLLLLLPGLCLGLSAISDSLVDRWPRAGVASIAAFTITAATWASIQYVNVVAETDLIENFSEMARFIESHSRPDQSIYGAVEVTPLLALKTHRSIAGSFFDTNIKHNLMGRIDPHVRLEEILKAHVKFVITTVVRQGDKIMGVEAYLPPHELSNHCQIAATFDQPRNFHGNLIVIWDCEPDQSGH
jgi:hypothetical protein